MKAFENLFPRNKNLVIGIQQNLKKKKSSKLKELSKKSTAGYNTFNFLKYLFLASQWLISFQDVTLLQKKKKPGMNILYKSLK